jgi:hypothetical protein
MTLLFVGSGAFKRIGLESNLLSYKTQIIGKVSDPEKQYHLQQI